MSYQALARKYRPQFFKDVIGQETAVQTLQNAIESGRIHHAYLFSGVRGVGKTTAARILAKALNCIKGPTTEPCNECTMCREITEGIDLDVREIDAATYTGVDNVRELRDVSQFQPARDRYRIFIIDEAHMLSTASWNALLKLIEEPPPHVVFMFATTEMQKVPSTIISRVQRHMLRKITLDELTTQLRHIVESEGIDADKGALEIIARRGEGSVRDSLSLLDQVIAFSGKTISVADVATVLGLSDTSLFGRLVALAGEGDHAGILSALQEAADAGRDFKMLFRDLLNFVRNLLLIAGGANESMIGAEPEDLVLLRETASKFSYSELLRIANLLLRDDETVNKAEHQRLAVELALLKAATFPRLRAIEEVVSGGVSASKTVAARPAQSRSLDSARDDKKSVRDDKSGARDGADAFVEKIKSIRPLIGSQLAGAKSMTKEGNRLTFTFDAAQSFYADSLTDQLKSLEETASEVYGTPTKIDIRVEDAPTGRRADDKPQPLQDDPVLGLFRKHLGGELVKENR